MRGSRLSGDASFPRVKRRRRRGGDAGGGGSSVVLDNSTISDAASIGDAVGNLSVLGGTGTYTFSLVSNPGGLFSISGSVLKVAAALTSGFDLINVKADNGVGDAPFAPFSIHVTHASGAFIPTFELLGF